MISIPSIPIWELIATLVASFLQTESLLGFIKHAHVQYSGDREAGWCVWITAQLEETLVAIPSTRHCVTYSAPRGWDQLWVQHQLIDWQGASAEDVSWHCRSDVSWWESAATA